VRPQKIISIESSWVDTVRLLINFSPLLVSGRAARTARTASVTSNTWGLMLVSLGRNRMWWCQVCCVLGFNFLLMALCVWG
jgi:hypothetical protein